MALLKNLRKLGALVPAAWPAFQAFDKAAMADGAVPVKYKELMAVAVALTTQCPYCIEAHTGKARAAGPATPSWARPSWSRPRSGPGAAIAHGSHCLKDEG